MDANDPILISKVRDKFCGELKSHPDLYDDCDLQRLMCNDWYIKRFLMATQLDVDNAFAMARDAMRWRKSYGVNTRSDADFPIEFYGAGAIFPYCADREGRPIAYLRVKIYKSFPKFSDYFKQFFIHIINNIDTQREENGWAMVWDLTGAGPSNWDLSMIRFVISSFRLYFPKGMQYLVIYGVPWIMTAFVNIGMKLLSEEARNKVIFASKDQIFSHIDPSNVPDFMGGKCEQNYRDVPKEVVRDCRDLGAERGINSDEIESVLKFIDKNNNV